MCRNIRPLFNFDPPATPEEIRAASLQFVRKISGYNSPPKDNQLSFNAAVTEISAAAQHLLVSLKTRVPPKNRENEAAKNKARSVRRFSSKL